MWIGWAKAPSLDEIARTCAHPQAKRFQCRVEHVPPAWANLKREWSRPFRVRVICPNGWEFYAPIEREAGRAYSVLRFKCAQVATRRARLLAKSLDALAEVAHA